MPGRNIVKAYQEDAFYHVYNRGINLEPIFLDSEDFRFFEWLLERTLGTKELTDKKGRPFTWLRDKAEINAYCLLPNHYHLLLYQTDAEGVSLAMRSIGTAYTGYFNRKYHRRGPLFENTFRAVDIRTDPQLLHITRYIHLNHHEFSKWQHSSYQDYLGQPRAWIETQPILELFDSKSEYQEFVQDYEAYQRELDSLKREFADGI